MDITPNLVEISQDAFKARGLFSNRKKRDSLFLGYVG